MSSESEKTKGEIKGQPLSRLALGLLLAIVAIVSIVCILSIISSSTARIGWSCTEYDGPFDVVFIDGEADVYGGVDEPSRTVKGHLTGGAGGIEAYCSGSEGTFYRLRGPNWWGWVRTSETYR